MNYDVKCPYCNAGQDICHDAGYGYSEGETHDQECGSCGKTFVYTTSISFYYTVDKADCLNGSEHDWQLTKTVPKCFAKMRCSMCDEEREPSEQERIKYSIPPYESYKE